MAATPVKNKVFFNLGIIKPTTSLDLSPWSPCTLDLPEKELPKSNSALRAFTADFVALWPNISVAKSPGNKENVLNIITENAKTVTRPRVSLNKIVLNIG